LAAHQLFGWFLRDDPARAQFHFSRTKGRISFLPWNYLNNGEAIYRNRMAAANAPI